MGRCRSNSCQARMEALCARLSQKSKEASCQHVSLSREEVSPATRGPRSEGGGRRAHHRAVEWASGLAVPGFGAKRFLGCLQPQGTISVGLLPTWRVQLQVRLSGKAAKQPLTAQGKFSRRNQHVLGAQAPDLGPLRAPGDMGSAGSEKPVGGGRAALGIL